MRFCGPVGREFEFAGPDLRAVLLALQFTDTGDEPVGGAVEALCVCASRVLTNPQRRFASLIRKLRSVGRGLCEDAPKALMTAAVASCSSHTGRLSNSSRPGRGAEQRGLLADHGGEGLFLSFDGVDVVHDSLLENRV